MQQILLTYIAYIWSISFSSKLKDQQCWFIFTPYIGMKEADGGKESTWSEAAFLEIETRNSL